MGVPGLTSFIDHNPQLLTDTKLSDCQLVIDGNNLYHFLYYYFSINHEFGGDYDTFYRSVKFFFNTLCECNIRPIVVFDGGHAQCDKKLKTSLRRARERLHLSGFLSHGGRGKVLPILVYETFCSALTDLRVPHVTCDYEADEQICALANALNCPVLSNDSDFFVFDLTAGVVLLDYMNLKLKKYDIGEKSYIGVQIFHLDTLINLFKPMEKRCMPLLATFIGNDFVDAEQFDTFLHTIKLPKPSCDKVFTPKRHPKIVSLLLWLKSHKSAETVVDLIIKSTKKCKVDQVKNIIEQSIESYSMPASVLANSLSSECQFEEPLPSSLKTYHGQPLCDWFLLQLHKGFLPVFMVNALVLHRQILLSQIEVMSEKSSYDCSKNIRKVIYGILLTCDDLDGINPNFEIGEEASDSQNNCIVEYTREKKTVLKSFVRPALELPNGKLVPKLRDIPSLKEEDKLDFFYNALDLNKGVVMSADGIPAEFMLVVASAANWITHADPKVNNLHVAALLVGLIKIAGLDPLNSENEHAEKRPTSEIDAVTTESSQVAPLSKQEGTKFFLIERCSPSELETAHRNIEKYNVPAKHSNVIQFNGACIHAFSQFQASFLHTTYLAKLLLISTKCTPEKVFNGTFLYSFYRELTNRKNPHLFIEELLGRSSYLVTLYQRLYDSIIAGLKDGDLVMFERVGSSKNTKKQKHKKSSNSKANLSASENVQEHDDQDSYFDVENRFGNLSVA